MNSKDTHKTSTENSPSKSDTSKTLTRLDVFQFTNYRAFLVAHFDSQKKRNTQFSYNAWAQHLGLKNNTSLLKIINGSRDAGFNITEQLAHYFKFSDNERHYFEDLVRLEKSKKNPRMYGEILSRIRRHSPHKNFMLLDEQMFSAISHWWYYAIRQLATLPNFKVTSQDVLKRLRFHVPPTKIAQALETLRKLNLLPDGTQKKKPLNTSDDVASTALRMFHSEVLELGREALEQISPLEREISGITLVVKKSDVPAAKLFIRDFQDEFNERFEKPTSDAEVYQLEVAFFPLTEKPKEPTP